MIDRPLFDAPPPARPKRQNRAGSKTPPLPARAKIPAEIWRIELSGHNRDGLPPVVCRIRRALKNAGRCYHLKAKVIACPPPIASPGDSAAYQFSDSQRAFVALKIENALAPEAKERQRQGGKEAGRGRKKVVSNSTQPILSPHDNKARTQAAKLAGPPPDATPGDSTGYLSSEIARGPETEDNSAVRSQK